MAGLDRDSIINRSTSNIFCKLLAVSWFFTWNIMFFRGKGAAKKGCPVACYLDYPLENVEKLICHPLTNLLFGGKGW
jgi:hypothetical protein